MNTSSISAKLEAVDFSVIDELSGLRPEDAFPIIEKALVHSNPDVRELGILALDKRPEAAATDLLMKSLLDEDESVQLASIRALMKRPAKRMIPELRKILDDVDPDVQPEIVLLMGMCDDPGQIEYLQQMLVKAQSGNQEELSTNCNLALARLGEARARNRIMARFESEYVEDRRDALGDIEYIHDPKLLVPLTSLLNDTVMAMDIGKDPEHVYLRLCDLFVLSANAVLGRPFPFAERGRAFSEDERRIVASYIEQHIKR